MAEKALSVYLSSTKADLLDEREAAKAVISSLHAVPVESYDADDNPPIEKCLRDVRRCDLYVGIVGHRYGSILQGGGTWPQAKSITEMEYEVCDGKRKIPRLIFIRENTPDPLRDGHGESDTARKVRLMEPIDTFRRRVAGNHTCVPFNSTNDLKQALAVALARRMEELRQATAPGPAHLEIARRLRPLVPVALLGFAGAAPPNHEAGNYGALFKPSLLDLARPDLLLQLETASRGTQVAALVFGSDGLDLLQTARRSPSLAALAAALRRRQGFTACLSVDLPASQLPAPWGDGVVASATAAEMEADSALPAQRLLHALQRRTSLAAGTRVAVPMLVLAPTLTEVRQLVDDLETTLHMLPDAQRRRRLKVQLATALRQARARHVGWPAAIYGERRDDWRCFGAAEPTIAELLTAALNLINHAGSGSREFDLLQISELEPRPYDLAELLLDVEGSAAVVRRACEQGALVLVDELVLLHPALREAARAVLACRRSAVATVGGGDPLRWPTRRMLDELSALGNGAIVDRFRLDMDVQCELALNSRERLERWLRAAIPRLVRDIDGLTPDPRIQSRMDERLRSDA